MSDTLPELELDLAAGTREALSTGAASSSWTDTTAPLADSRCLASSWTRAAGARAQSDVRRPGKPRRPMSPPCRPAPTLSSSTSPPLILVYARHRALIDLRCLTSTSASLSLLEYSVILFLLFCTGAVLA
uniref:Uncharacterized protein n=1 Tax=Leersia perrieri TaxID=77586 RepID=A0A0D9XFH0_9ORYZ